MQFKTVYMYMYSISQHVIHFEVRFNKIRVIKAHVYRFNEEYRKIRFANQ